MYEFKRRGTSCLRARVGTIGTSVKTIAVVWICVRLCWFVCGCVRLCALTVYINIKFVCGCMRFVCVVQVLDGPYLIKSINFFEMRDLCKHILTNVYDSYLCRHNYKLHVLVPPITNRKLDNHLFRYEGSTRLSTVYQA